MADDILLALLRVNLAGLEGSLLVLSSRPVRSAFGRAKLRPVAIPLAAAWPACARP